MDQRHSKEKIKIGKQLFIKDIKNVFTLVTMLHCFGTETFWLLWQIITSGAAQRCRTIYIFYKFTNTLYWQIPNVAIHAKFKESIKFAMPNSQIWHLYPNRSIQYNIWSSSPVNIGSIVCLQTLKLILMWDSLIPDQAIIAHQILPISNELADYPINCNFMYLCSFIWNLLCLVQGGHV